VTVGPFSAQFERQRSGLVDDKDSALAKIAADKAKLQTDFWDPNDPLARQNQLKEQFRQLRDVNKYSQASAGHLYSGSSATENSLAARDEGLEGEKLRRQFNDIMGSLSQAEGDVGRNFSRAMEGLDFDQARDAASLQSMLDGTTLAQPSDPAGGAAAEQAVAPPASGLNSAGNRAERLVGNEVRSDIMLKGGKRYRRYFDASGKRTRVVPL
jgi:hypothetical protein